MRCCGKTSNISNVIVVVFASEMRRQFTKVDDASGAVSKPLQRIYLWKYHDFLGCECRLIDFPWRAIIIYLYVANAASTVYDNLMWMNGNELSTTGVSIKIHTHTRSCNIWKWIWRCEKWKWWWLRCAVLSLSLSVSCVPHAETLPPIDDSLVWEFV